MPTAAKIILLSPARFTSASRNHVGGLLGLVDLLVHVRGRRRAGGGGHRRRRRGGLGGRDRVEGDDNLELDDEVPCPAVVCALAGATGRGGGLLARLRLLRLLNADAGDSVDVLEGGDEAGNGLLARGAADQL